MHRLVQRYAAEGRPTELDAAAALIRTAPDSRQRGRMLAAVAEAFKGRKAEASSAAFRRELASIDTRSKPEMLPLKLRLGAASQEEIKGAYRRLSDDDEKLKAQRTELIQALGEAKQGDAVDPLLAVAQSSRWHSVRKAALQALQEFDDERIPEQIIAGYSHLPRDQGVRAQAVEILSKRKKWSFALLRAVEKKEISRTDVPFDVVQRMKLYSDETLDGLIDKNWGKLRQSPKQLQQRMQMVEKSVRSGAGKQLFAGTCATCHKLYGEGQSIGPDLTGYERDNLDFLILSIVDPSAAIREEYTNFEVETTDGLLLTGFIVERGAESITIEDGQEGRMTVPKSRIKRLQASVTSRMPEGLLDALNEQQVRDLFAYLRSKPS